MIMRKCMQIVSSYNRSYLYHNATHTTVVVVIAVTADIIKSNSTKFQCKSKVGEKLILSELSHRLHFNFYEKILKI